LHWGEKQRGCVLAKTAGDSFPMGPFRSLRTVSYRTEERCGAIENGGGSDRGLARSRGPAGRSWPLEMKAEVLTHDGNSMEAVEHCARHSRWRSRARIQNGGSELRSALGRH
jgi:hypothetical protein